MANHDICTKTMWALSVPLAVLLVLFIALTAYATYSFHIFVPLAPDNDIDCAEMFNKSSENYLSYIENRTVLVPTRNDKNCFQIRRRRYLPSDMPKSMAGNHNMFFIRVVKKMFRLGDCMVNVLVPRELFNTSTAHGTLSAHRRCLKEIDEFDWKHAVITAEHDIPLHSTKFLSRRSRRLRDMVEINGVHFKEETLLSADPNDTSSQLYQVSRNWIQHLCSMATISHSQHKTLYNYLMKTPDFNLPSDEHREIHVLEKGCDTNQYDVDGSCLYAMQDFPAIRNTTRLFIRADPNYDFGFIQCVHEVVFERTFFDPISNKNAMNYLYGSHKNLINDYRN
ncbi:Protein CBG00952 [Caenorhabditis briggsae]|uniref:Protein CBG00952 n=1 Tax=Caenorhabditis briggsae TaxID=6238 RepID=A8WP92_CAEBR|nr:Protein CBG00952 [Caenorhabditis briggsae]CAP22298.2 Protein CBG00952 [Caenorhabditis briggsae]